MPPRTTPAYETPNQCRSGPRTDMLHTATQQHLRERLVFKRKGSPVLGQLHMWSRSGSSWRVGKSDARVASVNYSGITLH